MMQQKIKITLIISLAWFSSVVSPALALSMPIGINKGVAEQVFSTFADAPAMVAIARCESGIRQYSGNGMPLGGGSSGLYIGIFQISSGHSSEAESMGMDIYTAEGNIAYAKYLYQKYGTVPWKGCVPAVASASDTAAVIQPTSVSIATTTAPADLALSSSTPVVIPAAPVQPIKPALAGTITQNLKIGMSSSEVRTLQQMLNAAGFQVSTTGPGSPGNETSLFGSMTKVAVQKFQCAKLSVCSGSESTTGYGRVGPVTRAKLLSN